MLGISKALHRSVFVFSILLIPAVWLVRNRAFNQFLFRGRIEIVFAESRFVRKSEPYHKICCRERVIAKSKEKTIGWCFILVGNLIGNLIAILVVIVADNRNLCQAVFDDFEY